MTLPHFSNARVVICRLLLLISMSLVNISVASAQEPQAPAKETPPPPPKKQEPPPEMKIVDVFTVDPEAQNEDVKAGIGDRVRVHVEGLKLVIESAKIDPRKLFLYLDGLELKGVKARPIDIPTGVLEFNLERTPDSKAAWDSLLGRPNGFSKKVAVTVGPEGGQGISPREGSPPPMMTLRVFYPTWFYISTIAFLALLAVFWWRAIKGNIIRDSNPPEPPDGMRKPYSLARFQMAVWFFLVVGSFVLIYLITGDYNTVTEQALILIGIGTGTALGAAAIDANKRTFADTELNTLLPQRSKLDAQINEAKNTKSALEARIMANPPGAPDDATALAAVKIDLAEKESQLVELDKKIDTARSGLTKPVSEGFFNDLLTDANGTSFHRFQMLIWTIVLAFLFCVGVYLRLAMPEFSTTLLALMGISSGTYLGFKIPERQS